jgi:hypothetical protein
MSSANRRGQVLPTAASLRAGTVVRYAVSKGYAVRNGWDRPPVGRYDRKKTRRLLFPHLESHDMMELDRYA